MRHCGFTPAAHHRLLIEKLEAVARGEIKRLAVFMPPGSAKSTYASVLFPPWLLQAKRGWNVLAASHTTELAEKWGRRVRNLIADNELTLDIAMSADSTSAGRWALNTKSEYYAAGVGTGIAGFRANLGIIDDPIRSRQDADSDLIRDRVWDWYINDFRTRLVPGAAEILIQCMVGSTRVLLADGAEKPLADIRPGDAIATYEKGRVTTSRVLKWASQGIDRVFTIKMKSGTTVTANERHPFLVDRNGKLEWVKLKNMSAGDLVLRATGANGAALSAITTDATNPQNLADIACRTTIKKGGQTESAPRRATQRQGETHTLSIGTELAPPLTTTFSKNRAANARFAICHQEKMSGRTGAASCASITATEPEKFEACCVTTATSQLDTEKQKQCCAPPLNTYEITLDAVLEICPAGEEEVFDIQVDRTENFIANGLVSHNTRWHEDDLAGRALAHQAWETVSLPALATENDPLGRAVGEPLWSDDGYGYGAQLTQLAASTPPRTWNALYQQNPVPDDGTFFKSEWIGEYDKAPTTMHIYGASDFAVTEGDGDYTEHGVFGVDQNGNVYALDWWRGQASADVWIDRLCDLVLKHKPMCWFGEAGPIRRSIEPFLMRRMQERSAYCRVEWMASIHDKPTRARSIQALASMGKFWVPKSCPDWVTELRRQMLTFPAGKFDDAVDALSLFGRGLEFVGNAMLPGEPEESYAGSGSWMS